MPRAQTDLVSHLLDRLESVRRNLGVVDETAVGPDARFADLLGSMGMVEFLGLIADDCGTSPTALEECTARRFSTVAAFAEAMTCAGLAVQQTIPNLANADIPAPQSTAQLHRGNRQPRLGVASCRLGGAVTHSVRPGRLGRGGCGPHLGGGAHGDSAHEMRSAGRHSSCCLPDVTLLHRA